MGITIHFEGRLRDQEAFDQLMAAAKEYADAMQWPSKPIKEEQVTLLRARKEDEAEWDYLGPVCGLTLFPHEDCEPVRLEFDKNLYIQEYTKTQFAGPEVHVCVVGLLRRLVPFFDRLDVVDEGEFWETEDAAGLKSLMDGCNEAIQRELQRSPHAAVKVKTPDGRIVDMVE